MRKLLICAIVVAAGAVWVAVAARTADAGCGGAACALTAAPAEKPACGKDCTKPCCAAGPTGAKGQKACPADCAKPCCAEKPAAANAHWKAALGALDRAEKAVRAGDKDAALAALAEARKLLAARGEDKAAAVNATCPMTGRPVKAEYTRTYEGKTVGFCGPGCAGAWDRADDARRAAVAAKAVAAAKGPAGPTGEFANTRCPIMGGKIDPQRLTDNLTRTYHGSKVAFCCGGCPAAWDKLTDGEKRAKLAKAK